MYQFTEISNQIELHGQILNFNNKGDVLLEFSSVKWVLNEDFSFYSNFVGTLLLQNFALVNSYFIHFFRRTNDCGDTSH